MQRVWYEGGRFGWLLLPLSAIYGLISGGRRFLYRNGLMKSRAAPVPVIVVGNITAGGTGKTPTVIWLASELRARQFVPGIVSRGYGGSQSSSPMRVDVNSSADVVGDEPVLIARHSDCPVVVAADRVRAAEMLAEEGVDVIIADDGLQHYRLERDYEICIIDGSRALGNRRLLPAGPLREPPERLAHVDQLLINGSMKNRENLLGAEQDALEFELVASEARRLDGSATRRLELFSSTTVHAVAGIGNPGRFFEQLRALGIQVIEHAFPDHARLELKDLEFGDNFDVFMTEKDAVKLDTTANDKFWYVPVTLQMDPVYAAPLIEQIESRLRNAGGKS